MIRHHDDETANALYQSILERPHDLLVRLVYADRLDEIGESERAEFVRLQIENQHGEPGNGVRVARARKLFADGHKIWWPGEIVLYGRPSWEEWNDGRCIGLARNGFVEEIRCPLVWWLGGECGCFTNEPDAGCADCHGTGRILANGPAVVSKHPVTKVVISDREPLNGGDGARWLWFRDQSRLGLQPVHPESDLPNEIRDRIETDTDTGLAMFPTREAAVEAMSDALVSWAREKAGMSPLATPEEVTT